MWKTIKDFIFEEKLEATPLYAATQVDESMIRDYATEMQEDMDLIRSALAHYCRYCDTGFNTRGGQKNHIRLKHKEHYARTAPNQELPQAE